MQEAQPSTVREAAIQGHPATYLTIVSIIQSLALAKLIEVVNSSAHLWSSFDLIALTGWLQAAAVFLVVLGVWHEYVTTLTLFPWVFGLADSVIPLVFAIVEFALAVTMQQPERLHVWLAWIGILGVVSAGAYLNQAIKANRDSVRRDALTILNARRRGVYVLTLGGSGFFFVAATCVRSGVSSVARTTCVAAVVGVLVVYLVLACNRFRAYLALDTPTATQAERPRGG